MVEGLRGRAGLTLLQVDHWSDSYRLLQSTLPLEGDQVRLEWVVPLLGYGPPPRWNYIPVGRVHSIT